MITLQFDDIDQFAEMVYALIVRGIDPDRTLSHASWLTLPPAAKDAAREIARELANIFAAPQ